MSSTHDCEACRGNMLPGKSCYACGLEGPAGEGQALADLYEQRRSVKAAVARAEKAEAALADIAQQLHAHPDSVLTGEHGLAAATYRQAMAAEEADERCRDLQALPNQPPPKPGHTVTAHLRAHLLRSCGIDVCADVPTSERLRGAPDFWALILSRLEQGRARYTLPGDAGRLLWDRPERIRAELEEWHEAEALLDIAAECLVEWLERGLNYADFVRLGLARGDGAAAHTPVAGAEEIATASADSQPAKR